MRTVRTKVYKFSELSEVAKKKAIKEEYSNRQKYDNGDSLFFFVDHCSEVAKENGFTDIKVQYSFSSSQGDGLSFTANEIDIDRFIKEAIPDCKESVLKVIGKYASFKVEGNQGHYTYASRSDIDFWIDNPNDHDCPRIMELVRKIRIHMEEVYLKVCKQLETDGYAWIDDYYSDETIKSDIEANEYEFTQDGKRF